MVIDLLEKALRSRTGVVWVSSVDLLIMNIYYLRQTAISMWTERSSESLLSKDQLELELELNESRHQGQIVAKSRQDRDLL